VWRAVPETRPEAAKGPQGGGGGGVLTPFLDGRYAPFLFLNFLIALLFFQHLSSLPDDMMHKGLTTEAYGWAVATNGLLIVLVQPFVIRWLDGVAPARLLALGAALTGVGFGLTTFASTLPMYALTVAVWTAGEIVFSPVNASLVAQLSPDHLRGRYQGAFTITWSLAAMASPLLGSALLPLVGHRALWFSCGAIGLGVAAVHLTLSARALPKPAVSE
jgi:MFS family permease